MLESGIKENWKILVVVWIFFLGVQDNLLPAVELTAWIFPPLLYGCWDCNCAPPFNQLIEESWDECKFVDFN